jgi:hypothetical protein
MKIKNVSAKRWTGSDGATTVSIAPGETGELSEARAKLLLADFPQEFEQIGSDAVVPDSNKASQEIGALEIEITDDATGVIESERPRRRKGKAGA